MNSISHVNKKVNIGIIGFGKMGEYHLNVSSRSPIINISGIYDINKDRLLELNQKSSIKIFDSIEALLDHSDAIIIAAPTKFHHEISIKCLKAGKHVLVEKPMASNSTEASNMLNFASSNNLILQVGHVERFNGAVQEIKNIIKNPRIIEARRLAPFQPRVNNTGVVFDLMIHDIDIVLSLVGSKPQKIHAVGKKIKTDFEDIATCIMEFEGGTIAIISSSRVTEEKIRTLSISDEDAYIVLNYTTQDIEIHRQHASNITLYANKGLNYRQESIVERVMIHRDNPLKLEVEHFASCILGNENPIRMPIDELETISIAETILEQIHN